MVNKPIHKEPTNREHCCSCCPELEKEVRFLKILLNNQKGKLSSAKVKISELKDLANKISHQASMPLV